MGLKEDDTDGNKYWERVSEEMQFDDEIVIDNGVLKQSQIFLVISRIYARQQGFYLM